MIESLISGLVQGLTEFLPISSSGHLVLVHNFFGITPGTVFFDICLHAATMAAVIVYFRKDIARIFREKNIRIISYIVLATIPAVLAALFFEEKITSFFASPSKVGMMLIITSVILFMGQAALKRTAKQDKMTLRSALYVGVSQALALLPGISRSGTTISTALVAGVNAEESFRFSFLLSIPVILGAVVYKIYSAVSVTSGSATVLPEYIPGMIIAFAAGLASLRLLKWVVVSKKLYIFGLYCLVLGCTVTVLAR